MPQASRMFFIDRITRNNNVQDPQLHHHASGRGGPSLSPEIARSARPLPTDVPWWTPPECVMPQAPRMFLMDHNTRNNNVQDPQLHHYASGRGGPSLSPEIARSAKPLPTDVPWWTPPECVMPQAPRMFLIDHNTRNNNVDNEGNPKPEDEWPSEDLWKLLYPSLFPDSSSEPEDRQQQYLDGNPKAEPRWPSEAYGKRRFLRLNPDSSSKPEDKQHQEAPGPLSSSSLSLSSSSSSESEDEQASGASTESEDEQAPGASSESEDEQGPGPSSESKVEREPGPSTELEAEDESGPSPCVKKNKGEKRIPKPEHEWRLQSPSLSAESSSQAPERAVSRACVIL